MRADVLQVVAICAHGNGFLKGDPAEKPTELHRKNTTFKGCIDVIFKHGIGNAFTRDKPVLGTAQWYQRLRMEGVETLQLSLGSCTIDPAQQSEPPWGIVTDGAVGLELWRPNWKKLFARHDEPPTWDVTYNSSRYTLWSRSSFDKQEASAKLAEALRCTLELCQDRNMKDLGEPIGRSLDILGKSGLVLPATDLYPASLSREGKTLCTAAFRCVMILGSALWADAILSESSEAAEFSCVRDRLWKASMSAFEAAINA